MRLFFDMLEILGAVMALGDFPPQDGQAMGRE